MQLRTLCKLQLSVTAAAWSAEIPQGSGKLPKLSRVLFDASDGIFLIESPFNPNPELYIYIYIFTAAQLYFLG